MAAAPLSSFGPWVKHTSRSTGRCYYFNAGTNESLWHDDELPAGWAWGRDGGVDAGPRFFVHLVTGRRSAEPPSASVAAAAAPPSVAPPSAAAPQVSLLASRTAADDLASTPYIPDPAVRGANVPAAIRSKRDYLFSSVPEDVRWAVQVDDVALYSATEARTASDMGAALAALFPAGAAPVITDATAAVGGNTLAFARAFSGGVHAVELSPQRARMLAHNVSLLGPELARRVTVHAGDYVRSMFTLRQDVVFFDPPWGGPGYLGAGAPLDMFLGDTDVADVAAALCAGRPGDGRPSAAWVAIKAPLNYNATGLAAALARAGTGAEVARVLPYNKMQLLCVRAAAQPPLLTALIARGVVPQAIAKAAAAAAAAPAAGLRSEANPIPPPRQQLGAPSAPTNPIPPPRQQLGAPSAPTNPIPPPPAAAGHKRSAAVAQLDGDDGAAQPPQRRLHVQPQPQHRLASGAVAAEGQGHGDETAAAAPSASPPPPPPLAQAAVALVDSNAADPSISIPAAAAMAPPAVEVDCDPPVGVSFLTSNADPYAYPAPPAPVDTGGPAPAAVRHLAVDPSTRALVLVATAPGATAALPPAVFQFLPAPAPPTATAPFPHQLMLLRLLSASDVGAAAAASTPSHAAHAAAATAAAGVAGDGYGGVAAAPSATALWLTVGTPPPTPDDRLRPPLMAPVIVAAPAASAATADALGGGPIDAGSVGAASAPSPSPSLWLFVPWPRPGAAASQLPPSSASSPAARAAAMRDGSEGEGEDGGAPPHVRLAAAAWPPPAPTSAQAGGMSEGVGEGGTGGPAPLAYIVAAPAPPGTGTVPALQPVCVAVRTRAATGAAASPPPLRLRPFVHGNLRPLLLPGAAAPPTRAGGGGGGEALSTAAAAASSSPSAALLAVGRALGLPTLRSHEGGGPAVLVGSGARGAVYAGSVDAASAARLLFSRAALKVQPWDERVAAEVAATDDILQLHEHQPMSGRDEAAPLATAYSPPLLALPLLTVLDSEGWAAGGGGRAACCYQLMHDAGHSLAAALRHVRPGGPPAPTPAVRLPPRTVLALYQRLLRALAVVHAAGYLHADVHPDNVMLLQPQRERQPAWLQQPQSPADVVTAVEAARATACLADFGSARRLTGGSRAAAASPPHYTGPTRGGRWDVMPPEQFPPAAPAAVAAPPAGPPHTGTGSGATAAAASDVTLWPCSDVFAAAATAATLLAGGVAPFGPGGGGSPPGRLTLRGTREHPRRAGDGRALVAWLDAEAAAASTSPAADARAAHEDAAASARLLPALRRAMNADPARRPQSAERALEDLDTCGRA